MSTVYARFAGLVDDILDALEGAGELQPGLARANISVEPPRDAAHGDLATNVAMVLAKPAGTNPRALAALIVPRLEQLPEVLSADIAGPGFINMRLDPIVWQDELRAILAAGGDYGRSTIGTGVRVNVEYVSANPTGPMHMGHCRGAVVGDALASLLRFAGSSDAEYYVTPRAAMGHPRAVAWLRYRDALGLTSAISRRAHPGDYLSRGGARLARCSRAYVRLRIEWLCCSSRHRRCDA